MHQLRMPPPVPQLSTLNLLLRFAFVTSDWKTASAAGLLQMLPKHTKRTPVFLSSAGTAAACVRSSCLKKKFVALWTVD